MDNIDWDKVLKYVLLSGMAGSTVASVAGLNSLLKTQKYYDKGPSHWDDDTLYVMKKQSATNIPGDPYSNGLLLAGIPLAFGGGFALTNYLFNKYMRYEAQKELDKSQLAFINNSGYSNLTKKDLKNDTGLKKAAGNYDNLVHNVGIAGKKLIELLNGVATDTAAPIVQKAVGEGTKLVQQAAGPAKVVGHNMLGWGAGAALLTALASGAATYAYLNSSWPINKPKVLAKPKKIQVVDDIGKLPGGTYYTQQPETGEDVAGIDKQSSINGIELTARMLCNMDKSASVAADVVYACAAGRADEFEKAVEDIGFVNALNLVKGAATCEVNDVAKELAVTYCTKVASFAEPFRLAVAADYLALHPEMCKLAAILSDDCIDFLNAFANDFNNAINADFAIELGATEDLCKSASINNDFIGDSFKAVLCKLAASPILDNSDLQSSDTSSGALELNSYKSKLDIHNESKAYKDAQLTGAADIKDDIIDTVMQGVERPNVQLGEYVSAEDTASDSSLLNV